MTSCFGKPLQWKLEIHIYGFLVLKREKGENNIKSQIDNFTNNSNLQQDDIDKTMNSNNNCRGLGVTELRVCY